MVLCLTAEKGSVSGDDTQLSRFGASTLAGWAQNKDAELFEVYQIDRRNGGSTRIAVGLGTRVGAAVAETR